MSLNRETPSSSTLSNSSFESSGSSRSSSTERRSYLATGPATKPTTATHSHRRNVHSAPAAFTTVRTPSQTSNLTSDSFCSSGEDLSASTLVDSSTHEKPTLRDAYEKEEALKPKFKHHGQESSTLVKELEPEKPKAKRSCASGLEFDWTYTNVYTSGSRHGRKTIGSGSGAPGACSLM